MAIRFNRLRSDRSNLTQRSPIGLGCSGNLFSAVGGRSGQSVRRATTGRMTPATLRIGNPSPHGKDHRQITNTRPFVALWHRIPDPEFLYTFVVFRPTTDR
jgi:hypothetical protein